LEFRKEQPGQEMSGPIQNADPASRDCIDCEVEYEVAFWTAHFRVSRDKLLVAISIVGPRISDLTAHIIIEK
jgi:hypothetical protein